MSARKHYPLVMVLRGIRASWIHCVVLACLALLAVTAYTGLEGAWNGMNSQLNQFIDDTHLADLWYGVTTVDDQTVDQIKALDHVSGVEVRHQFTARIIPAPDADAATSATGVWTQFTVLDDPANWTISVPKVVTGSPLSSAASGVWLDDALASTSGFAVSDTVEVRAASPDGDMTATAGLRGTVLSPDQVYAVEPTDLNFPDPGLYGYGYITQQSATALFGDTIPLSTTILVATDAVDDPAVDSQIRAVLHDNLVTAYNRETNPTVAPAIGRVDSIRNLSLIFSALVILVTLLALFTSAKRLVDRQAPQIVALRALGFSKGQLIGRFSSVGWLAAAIGALIGLACSLPVSKTILASQKAQFSLPSWGVDYSFIPLVVVVIVIIAAGGGAAWAARCAMTGEPAARLRPGVRLSAPGRSGTLGHSFRGLAYPMRWAWRDLLAKPARLVMAVLGLVGSLMVLVAGFALPDTFAHGVDNTYSTVQGAYQARVDFAAGAAAADIDSLASLGSAPQFLMQISVATEPPGGGDTIITIVGDGDYYPLVNKAGEAYGGDGVWVSQGTDQQLGVAPGDQVSLTPLSGSDPLTLTVTGVASRTQPRGFFMSQTTWESLGQQFTPTAALVGADADLATLASSPLVSYSVTRAQQHDNALSLLDAMNSIFWILRLFAVVLAVVLLYSLGRLGFEERRRQYATLKVLGFPNNQLRQLSAVGNVPVTVVGLAVGIPVGLWFASVCIQQFNTHFAHYSSSISALSVLICLGLVIVFSALTTLLLGRRVAAVNLAETLKGVG